MKLKLPIVVLTFVILHLSFLIGNAQTLTVTGGVPPYLDISGLSQDDTRHMEHEFTVLAPASSGTVQVRLGFAPGDTGILVRDFALGNQHFADSTWVQPATGGHLIGLGRFTGLDAVYVELRQGGSSLGSGVWERP